MSRKPIAWKIGDRVFHPQFGEGEVASFADDWIDEGCMIVRFNRTPVKVIAKNLKPAPEFDQTWSFEFRKEGPNTHVTARHGAEGSRAFLGNLTLNEFEAAIFEAIVTKLGAKVSIEPGST